ncbi:hypothetical protein [Paracoccus lutimaris]|uniref:Phosphatidate cytidylyltransferase n=1 Tax=Paracoccus lutimaris TaxID=1490030 RepID=A0A368Z3Z6_9RHOB|nr:hypothetical protein [Paracoccus lutimaris]RCW86669.1 hypothetical protein DFP89_10455 [Paracoccus lutimaris]
MSGALPPLTRRHRFALAAAALALALAGLALWAAYGIPVALLAAGLLC